jgi:S-DNA-T family DNA segregation ATPase FtsK/SpoIIIE
LVYGGLSGSHALLLTGGIVVLASLLSPFAIFWSSKRSAKKKHDAQLVEFKKLAAAIEQELASDEGPIGGLRAYYDRLAVSPKQLEAGYIQSARLWERRRLDDDFASFTVGRGSVPSGLQVRERAAVEAGRDDVARLEHLQALASYIPDCPVQVSLNDHPVVSIDGPRPVALGLARSALIELCATCGPDELSILVAHPVGRTEDWAWVKALPHVRKPPDAKGNVSVRFATSRAGLDEQLREVLAPRLRLADDPEWSPARAGLPQVVVVIDEFHPGAEVMECWPLGVCLERGAALSIATIVLSRRPEDRPSVAKAIISIADARSRLSLLGSGYREEELTSLSQIAHDRVSAFSLDLADLVPVTDEIESASQTSTRLVDLLGDITDVSTTAIPPRPVPLGVAPDGKPIVLDIREAAVGGSGPHGVIVGATGSGKSELLRSVVAALAASHTPEELTMLLIDFKGGPTFRQLQKVPHCVGFVTNVADDLTLIDRMREALQGELFSRQKAIAEAPGFHQKLSEYNDERKRHPELPIIPSLVIVVDEFAELLAARPDFLDTFISLARTGRNVGVHLMLASQRLEAGRLRGLDTYLSYWICLRTFTAEESVAAIGTRHAADLPPLPGMGFFKDAEEFSAFRAARVTQAETESPRFDVAPVARRNRFGQELREPTTDAEELVDDGSDLGKIVSAAAAASAAAERLWLDPLPSAFGEPLLLSDVRLKPSGSKYLPIGLLDLPRDRKQPALELDFSSAGSHVMIAGAPKSGKSTFAETIVLQAGRLYPASDLQFCVLEAAPHLFPFRALWPNVAAIATWAKSDDVVRIMQFVTATLDMRAQQAASVDSAAEEPSAGGGAPRLGKTSVGSNRSTLVLIIDGLLAFRERYPEMDEFLAKILSAGSHLDVFLVASSGRWADLPTRRLEQVGTRLELRLSDPSESMFGRTASLSLSPLQAGRGLSIGAQTFQIAAAHHGVAGLKQTVKDLSAHHKKRWPAGSPPKVLALKDISLEEWRATHDGAVAPMVGVAEATYAPHLLNLGSGRHIVCEGDTGTGKSTFLRRMLEDIAALDPDALIFGIDLRGSLRAARVKFTDIAFDAASAQDLVQRIDTSDGPTKGTVIGGLANLIFERQRSHIASLKGRSSTEGHPAPLVLVVDDYDLLMSLAPDCFALIAPAALFSQELNFTIMTAEGAASVTGRGDPLMRRVTERNPIYLDFGTTARGEPLRSRRKGTFLDPGYAYLVESGHELLHLVLPPKSGQTLSSEDNRMSATTVPRKVATAGKRNGAGGSAGRRTSG